ncbi:MAG: hypothetical protein DHS20C21_13220 [Gemmatimonadota bacterium]|nr:MAG: hypothetical protein DHS20C21_13220 [Gemmatimonadota bacterium]
MERVVAVCRLLFGLLTLAVAGCGSGDLTLSQADPDIVARSPAWEVVYPIFQRECIPCHTGTEDSSDEPDEDDSALAARSAHGPSGLRAVGGVEPGLESCEAIQDNLDDIFIDIFVDNNMPPGAWPRLTSREKLIIQRWIDNGAEGPCN